MLHGTAVLKRISFHVHVVHIYLHVAVHSIHVAYMCHSGTCTCIQRFAGHLRILAEQWTVTNLHSTYQISHSPLLSYSHSSPSTNLLTPVQVQWLYTLFSRAIRRQCIYKWPHSSYMTQQSNNNHIYMYNRTMDKNQSFKTCRATSMRHSASHVDTKTARLVNYLGL